MYETRSRKARMPTSPNIIYVLSDEHRGQAMGHAGNPFLRESRDPYWDVLIEHGVEPDGPVVDVSQNSGRRLPYLQ